MNEVICKKCKVSNDAALEYCQLCGANLKSEKEGVPGNIFIARVKFQFVDTFVAWENETLYAIPITTISQAADGGGGVLKLSPGAAIKRAQENKYAKEIFPLPLDQQVKIQKGLSVKYSEITKIKEHKGFMGFVTVEVYTNESKPVLVITGSKPDKENFIQKAGSHGFIVERK